MPDAFEAVPDWEPDYGDPVTPKSNGNHRPIPLNALTIPDPRAIRPRPWLYGYWLMRGAVTLIAAPGGTGKTSLVTTSILACATGRDLLSIQPLRQMTVAFLGLEETTEETHRRFAAGMIHYGIKPEEIKGQIYYLDGRDYGFSAGGMVNGEVVESYQMPELTMWLQIMGVDILFADPLALAHSAPENDNGAMAKVISYFTALAGNCDCGVCLIHHTRKGAIAGDPDGIRGAGALINHARVALGLAPMSEEEAQLFGVTPDDRKRLVRLDDLKMNYARKAGEAKWVRLESVNLGNATAEYPHGDSVQVATAWEPPESLADLTIEIANQILDEIDAGKDGERYAIQRNTKLPAHQLVKDIMAMHGLDKSDSWCRQLIGRWLKTQPPVLSEAEYTAEAQRKTRKGLFVNAANRPGNHPF